MYEDVLIAGLLCSGPVYVVQIVESRTASMSMSTCVHIPLNGLCNS